MKLAFLCPGQASQKVGMGHDLYINTEIGKKYFDRANEIMGVEIQDIIFNGPEETLRQTRFTQPSIYIVSVILGTLLKNNGVQPTSSAGHSLGEYSALALAGAFDFETGLKLVKVRAESMQKAGETHPGSMAAIIGLKDPEVINICAQYQEGIVVSANFNAPGQVVISGERPAVQAIMNLAKDAGAMKVVELNVSGAFHSPLMSSAREVLAEMLNSIEIQDTQFPVYANVTAEPMSQAGQIRQALIDQLESPVLWHATLTHMIRNGITNAVEVGPGRVLQGLARRIDRSLVLTGVESLEQVEQYTNV